MLTVVLASGFNSQLINGLIPLGFGIYLTLAGFGLIPAGSDKKSAAARARWVKHGKIGGPLLIAFGLYMLARALW